MENSSTTKNSKTFASSSKSRITTRPQFIRSPTTSRSTIKTLKAALKTKLEDLKGKWVEYLSKVLWAYRTTRKSATQETPFALAFGTEVVAPVEVGLESPRVKFANAEHNKESLRLNGRESKASSETRRGLPTKNSKVL